MHINMKVFVEFNDAPEEFLPFFKGWLRNLKLFKWR